MTRPRQSPQRRCSRSETRRIKMAEDFKWENVINDSSNEGATPPPPATPNPADELEEILGQFRDSDGPPPQQEQGQEGESFVPAYVPRDIVDPAKTTGKYFVEDALQEP